MTPSITTQWPHTCRVKRMNIAVGAAVGIETGAEQARHHVGVPLKVNWESRYPFAIAHWIRPRHQSITGSTKHKQKKNKKITSRAKRT